ncbi:MAG: PKD domain-containing protein [Solirubrobacterales bacterium]
MPASFRGLLVLSLVSLVSIALTAMLAVAPAPALAAPSWLEPKDLSEEGFGAFGPRVGLDANGEAVTSWYGATSATGDTTQISERPRAGVWSAPQNLRVDGTNTPDLAVSPNGTAVVAWEFDAEEGSPLGSYIEAGVRTNGVWSVPPKSGTDPLHFSYYPQVAMDAAGDAIIAWQECYSADKHLCFENKGEYAIEAKVRWAGGNWGAPIEVTSGTSENAKKLSAAINPFGDIAVAWEDMKSQQTRVSLLRAGQSPDYHTLATKASGSPQVAFAADGTAITVWDEEDPGLLVSASTAAPGTHAWTQPQHISSPGYAAFQPRLAVAPDGEAVATWETLSGGNPIQAAIRAGGVWLPAQNISAEGVEATHPRVAMNPAGAAIAAWRETGSSGSIVKAATRSSGGGWSAPKALSEATAGAVEPAVAIDPEGDGVVAWRAVDPYERIQVVGLDAAGPRLDGLTIPAAGIAGQPLGFGVAPSDAWSALAGTSWSFGDGTVANGTSAAHTFAQPGTYQVTVSGTDALGNFTSASRAVTVTSGQTGLPSTGGQTTTPTSQQSRSPDTDPTTTTSKPSRTVHEGVARFLGAAAVRGGKAVLALRCAHGARCAGLAKLVFRRTYVIGKSRFKISAGGSRTLRIAIGPAALRLLEAAPGQRLTLRLEGRGVRAQKVVLGL